MRKRTRMGMLVALGHETWEPSPEQRDMVRVLAFNRVPLPRIAELLGVSETVLKLVFPRELELAEDEITAIAAMNVLQLAEQREHLPTAMRANELILRTRLAIWREPKPTETDASTKRISDMSLDEVEAEIDRMERAEARTAEAQEDDPPRKGKPH